MPIKKKKGFLNSWIKKQNPLFFELLSLPSSPHRKLHQLTSTDAVHFTKGRQGSGFSPQNIFLDAKICSIHKKYHPRHLLKLISHIELCDANCKFKQQIKTKQSMKTVMEFENCLQRFFPSLKFQHISIENNKIKQSIKTWFLMARFIG